VQVEMLNRRRWRTHLELAAALFEYLEIFSNRRARRSCRADWCSETTSI